MTNTYILTSARLDGTIELTYTDGLLNVIKIVVNSPLNEAQYRAIAERLPYSEKELDTLVKLGLICTMELTTNQKIALFCDLYKEYKKIKYDVSAADSGKIKLIRISEPMLHHYFKSDNFLFKAKHSIFNLVKYYNELKAEIAASGDVKSKHPDHYSAQYEKKLSEKELSEYWQHLHSMGLKPKRDRFNKIIDWIKV